MPQVVMEEVGGQQIVVGEIVPQVVMEEVGGQQIVVGGIGSNKLLGQKMATLGESLSGQNHGLLRSCLGVHIRTRTPIWPLELMHKSL